MAGQIRKVMSREHGISRLASSLYEWLGKCKLDEVALGICGGTSIQGLGAEIVRQRSTFPAARFMRVNLFQTDEFVADDSRPENNWTVIQREVIDPLVQAGMFRPERAFQWKLTGDQHEDVQNYMKLLQPFGRFHAAIFGVGGGLFPHTAFEDYGHLAAIFGGDDAAWKTSAQFLCLTGAPKPPSIRYTMSVEHLQELDMAWAVFFGPDKKNVLRALMKPTLTALECPARLVLSHPRGLIITDQGLECVT